MQPVLINSKILTSPSLLNQLDIEPNLNLVIVIFSRLLWTVKKANVYGLLEDVSLYRFHYVCASFKRVCAGLDVDLRVQGKKLKCVMVPRETGWRVCFAPPLRAVIFAPATQL